MNHVWSLILNATLPPECNTYGPVVVGRWGQVIGFGLGTEIVPPVVTGELQQNVDPTSPAPVQHTAAKEDHVPDTHPSTRQTSAAAVVNVGTGVFPEELGEIVDPRLAVWAPFVQVRNRLRMHGSSWWKDECVNLSVGECVGRNVQQGYTDMYRKKKYPKIKEISKTLGWPESVKIHNCAVVRWAKLLMTNAQLNRSVDTTQHPHGYAREAVPAIRKAAVLFQGFGDAVPDLHNML